MKKILTFSLSLFLINFVSAYSAQASLQNILNELDPSTAILGSLFLIFFLLTNYALAKALKDQKGIAGILAFIVSFLAIYTINRSGFNYQNIYYELFYNIGLSTGVASTFLPIILFAIAIFIVIKFGMGVLLMAFGAFTFGYGIGFAYEKAATMFLGVIFTAIGWVLFDKKRKAKKVQKLRIVN